MSNHHELRKIYRKRARGLRLNPEELERLLKEERSMHQAGKTNRVRWASPESVDHGNWDARKDTIARLIPEEATTIADYGCGNQKLRDFLGEEITYIPIDVIARDENVRVIDLNSKGYALPYAKCAIFSGTLEYIYDIPHLLKKLGRRSRWVISSYSPLRTDSEEAIQLRTARSWVNHFTVGEFIGIFEKHRYKCTQLDSFENQVVVRFEKF